MVPNRARNKSAGTSGSRHVCIAVALKARQQDRSGHVRADDARRDYAHDCARLPHKHARVHVMWSYTPIPIRIAAAASTGVSGS